MVGRGGMYSDHCDRCVDVSQAARGDRAICQGGLMSEAVGLQYEPRRERVGFYYGWVVLVVAALAMVCTFPGRSLGRGLITEPLLADLNLTKVSFGWITLWATLIGSTF